MAVKLRIGIFTLGLPFTGAPIAQKSLGGSETALWYVARHLRDLGHEVRVFNNCPEPGNYDGVIYHDQSEWGKYRMVYEFDVVISSRIPNILSQVYRSALNILWCHDMPPDEPNQLMVNLWKTDFVFMLSQFQREQYSKLVSKEDDKGNKVSMLDSLLYTTKNGIDLELIEQCGEGIKRDIDAMIYSSRPERGLYVLLRDIWPKIHEKRPNAKLYVCSYGLGNFPVPDYTRQMYADIDLMITRMKDKNVIRLGELTKEEYYKVLRGCSLWLYPTAFPEISCINAMEAMAAGVVPVSTNDFALKETVGDKGILVSGLNETAEYHEAYVREVLNLLENNFRCKQLRVAGQHWVKENYQWKDVVADWEQLILKELTSRVESNPDKIARELLRYDDYAACEEFAKRYSVTDEAIVEDLRVSLEGAEQAGREEEVYSLGEQAIAEKRRLPVHDRVAIAAQFYKFHGPGKRFLDIGCHWGEIASEFSQRFPGVHFVGVDLNPKNLDVAKRYTAWAGHKDSAFEFFEGRLDTIIEKVQAGEVEPFDSVFAGEIVEHILDTKKFMERLTSIVKEDGNIVITVPSGCWRPMVGFQSKERGGHVRHFTMTDIESIWGQQKDYSLMFVSAGFNYAQEIIGNWVITFRKDSTRPFGEHDYDHKFLVTRPHQSLSLAMIVKNEEDNISRALKAVQTIPNEIIIYDTGSTDATKEIVRKFQNVKLIEGSWEDDFSAARNHSLDACVGDWVLWQDADEILVNADHLPKYMNSKLYNGFVIRQNHLMLDMQSPPDTPVRLFKNFKGYRFFGVIHEHAQVTLEQPIDPVFVLPDVDIAHYGYIVESVRRWRCKERNLPLLLKDRAVNPTRKLGFILLQRDYLNLQEWEFEMTRGKATEAAVRYLRMACRIYWEQVKDESHPFHKLSWPLYQRALERLGIAGIPADDSIKHPPFQVAFSLAGAVGGLNDGTMQKLQPTSVWFASQEEYQQHMAKTGSRMFELMRLSNAG